MGKQKIEIAYINDDSARRATYRKRKMGLLKKVSELSTLCGIISCAIIYCPFESEPVVWPSVPEAKSILSKFKGMPESQKLKKMFDQKDILKQRIAKTKEKIRKQREENRLKIKGLEMHGNPQV